MPDLVRGEANDKDNPQVIFAWQIQNEGDNPDVPAGFFQPFSDLDFEVARPDGTIVVASTAVDPLDTDNQLDPTDNDGKGLIIILPFTIDGAEPLGVYTVTVNFTVDPENGGATFVGSHTMTFRLLDEAHPYVTNSYAQIQDMLDAGFPVAEPAPVGGYSFTDATRALTRASEYIELITSRFFNPRYLSHDKDGQGGPMLQTEHVIIGLTEVVFTFTTFTPSDIVIFNGDLRVYNRHIRQKLLEPDDRRDPRIEFLRTDLFRYSNYYGSGGDGALSSYSGFTESQQNIKLRGMWGFTDPSDSPFGKTPELIKEVTLRLAARYIKPLWSQIGGAGAGAGASGPAMMEKTEDQEVKYSEGAVDSGNGAFVGSLTGDPEIDQLLVLFMASPKFRSA